MKTFVILVNNGYRFEYGQYSETIKANSAQEARKIFLNRNTGCFYATPSNIKAHDVTKVLSIKE